MNDIERRYLELFLAPIRKCRSYRPKFGKGNRETGLSLGEFKTLYGSDSFYAWVGLDTDLMYSAHRAAGGMTSVYRQIGIGCERLFRAILADTACYTEPEYAEWSYTAKTRSGKEKKLSLDGRLELAEINDATVLKNIRQWIDEYCSDLREVAQPANGIVFEVRQGYKSKDSKRQNADIDNATVAWANGYLPVFAIFSSQIDADIVLRYRNNRCGILIGTITDDDKSSLYAFCRQVLGYDLAEFFRRYSNEIKAEIHDVIETLLSTD
ncbi:MAG: hypothetical protein SD837_14750 [Candidatus Electrothrix scaldis]|nr:MAG: hypothetical protein SD837_14750 [Candidatus Electrothrix sp. GW3-3]